MRIRKIRPGHRIAALLVAAQGNPVPLAAIKELFSTDPTLAPTEYKISGYVGDIRKYDLGVVRVVKEGRAVVSYQLANFDQFNENGQNVTLSPKPNVEPEVKSETTSDNVVLHATAEITEAFGLQHLVDVGLVNIIENTNEDTTEIVTNGDPTMSDEGHPLDEPEMEHPSENENDAIVVPPEKMDRNARRRAARAAQKMAA